MKFTEEHEWLESDGDMVKVGITEYPRNNWEILYSLNYQM